MWCYLLHWGVGSQIACRIKLAAAFKAQLLE